jgi:hypothetical protein
VVQPEDDKTIPLPLPDVTQKPSRGRPPKPGALTNAQRQAVFRARLKTLGIPVTVTKNAMAVADGDNDLVLESERLRKRVANLERELASVRVALRKPVGRKWSYRQFTDAAETQIYRFVGMAETAKRDEALAYRAWAYGVYSAWYELAVGWMDDGDADRLYALVRNDVTSNEKSGV